MPIYDVDYSILIKETMPPDKRQDVILSWVNALLVTLKETHADQFQVYRPDVIARAKHNGQKIIVEDILNNKYAIVASPFIYIDNTGDNVESQIMYNESEGLTPLYLRNEAEGTGVVYFRNASELSANTEFIVYVPNTVLNATTQIEIETEIERLRPYSTIYQIVGY